DHSANGFVLLFCADWLHGDTVCLLSGHGAPSCTFFAQHGVCKFGPSCKFDHPMAILSYSPSASSLADVPVAPYPVGLSGGILAPSSSSTDLRHEFVAGASNKDSFSTQILSSGNTSSSSIGSIVSKDGIASHSLVQAPLQSSAPSTTSGSIGHGGEVTSSR
ncbi:hypothetical protein Taro_012438, partial [Colocasia esculenta]|nr:hypothetical protein [Colocasia esculenta]